MNSPGEFGQQNHNAARGLVVCLRILPDKAGYPRCAFEIRLTNEADHNLMVAQTVTPDRGLHWTMTEVNKGPISLRKQPVPEVPIIRSNEFFSLAPNRSITRTYRWAFYFKDVARPVRVNLEFFYSVKGQAEIPEDAPVPVVTDRVTSNRVQLVLRPGEVLYSLRDYPERYRPNDPLVFVGAIDYEYFDRAAFLLVSHRIVPLPSDVNRRTAFIMVRRSVAKKAADLVRDDAKQEGYRFVRGPEPFEVLPRRLRSGYFGFWPTIFP